MAAIKDTNNMSTKSNGEKSEEETNTAVVNGSSDNPELDERLHPQNKNDNDAKTAQTSLENGTDSNKESDSNVDSNLVTNSDTENSKKRKAEDCVSLDDSSEDDIIIQEEKQPNKKIKISGSNVDQNGVKKNIKVRKNDGGYGSDNSLEIDEPEAIDLDSDTEEMKEVPSNNLQTKTNGESLKLALSESSSETDSPNEKKKQPSDAKKDKSTESIIIEFNDSKKTKSTESNKSDIADSLKADTDGIDSQKRNCLNLNKSSLQNGDGEHKPNKDKKKTETKAGLELECFDEELVEPQTESFNKLTKDFNHLLDVFRTHVPNRPTRGYYRRGPGRRGAYSYITNNSTTPPTTGVASSTSTTTATPSTSYAYRGRARGNYTGGRSGAHNRGDRDFAPSTSTTSSSSSLPKRAGAAARNYREDSPEIEVVSEKKSTQTQLPRKEPPKVASPAKPAGQSVGSSAALLNILARPRNMYPVAIAVKDRKELDVMVKSSLVKTQQSFTEWLFSIRLLKDRMMCPKHPYSSGIKLGLYQSPSVLPSSGGYVWMMECCPGGRRYVSIYSGSIFTIGIKESITSTSVLKLIYHWSCQTTISNVENWVKVGRDVIGRSYHYLRAICSIILQDKLYDMGSRGTTVELGIVSLGTTTSDGSKKAVKVEIVGIYDRSTEAYRLYASSPQNNANSSQRFMRILKPVLSVVHHNAEIVCDYSIDKNCLPSMNYKKVVFCNQNQEGTSENSNATIMSYLRKHVPKMFQNSLSQLSLEQVQLVLDELCWRETFGRSPSHAYTNMMKHLGYLTARETENNGLLTLLDYVALNPHKSWRYVPLHFMPPITVPPISPATLPPTQHPVPQATTITRSVAPTVHPAVDLDAMQRPRVNFFVPVDVDPANVMNPLLHTNKMVLSIVNNQVHPIRNTAAAKQQRQPLAKTSLYNRTDTNGGVASKPAPHRFIPPTGSNALSSSGGVVAASDTNSTAFQKIAIETVDLVPYFYGEVPGDDTVGKEINFCELECHKCHEVASDNISFYEHLKTHLFEHRLPSMITCRYCILQFLDQPSYEAHIKEVHDAECREHLCRICMISFDRPMYLVSHMTEKHVEAELPYRCEVCNFSSSYYTKVIDHFIEKHRGTPYIQCHFCLMVKVVSPGNIATMSQWTLSHLVDHAKGVRCNFCVLSIKNKSKKSIAGHMVVHNTYKGRKDLVRYSSNQPRVDVPKNRLGLAAPWRSALPLSNPIVAMRSAVAMSRLVEDTSAMDMIVAKSDICKECEQPMNTDGHYQAYQSCTQCPYATSCSVMMPRHNYVFHPAVKTRKPSYVIGPPITLSEPLVCNCGFSSTSGNHIASHLQTCQQSTRTGYPAMAESPADLVMQVPPQVFPTHFLSFELDDAARDDNEQLICLAPKVQLDE